VIVGVFSDGGMNVRNILFLIDRKNKTTTNDCTNYPPANEEWCCLFIYQNYINQFYMGAGILLI
jgi:hypothetical protein